MSACDITGLSTTAFDHKQILRCFYLTLKTCLIETFLFKLSTLLDFSMAWTLKTCLMKLFSLSYNWCWLYMFSTFLMFLRVISALQMFLRIITTLLNILMFFREITYTAQAVITQLLYVAYFVSLMYGFTSR